MYMNDQQCENNIESNINDSIQYLFNALKENNFNF